MLVLIQKQISSEKHTGFEESSHFNSLLSLPFLADFFFVYQEPLSEVNNLLLRIERLLNFLGAIRLRSEFSRKFIETHHDIEQLATSTTISGQSHVTTFFHEQ